MIHLLQSIPWKVSFNFKLGKGGRRRARGDETHQLAFKMLKKNPVFGRRRNVGSRTPNIKESFTWHLVFPVSQKSFPAKEINSPVITWDVSLVANDLGWRNSPYLKVKANNFFGLPKNHDMLFSSSSAFDLHVTKSLAPFLFVCVLHRSPATVARLPKWPCAPFCRRQRRWWRHPQLAPSFSGEPRHFGALVTKWRTLKTQLAQLLALLLWKESCWKIGLFSFFVPEVR